MGGFTMKKLLLGSVALVALGTAAPAIAADFAVPRHVAYVGGTNWTGCHVGGSFGDSWGNSPGYSSTASTTTSPIPGSGVGIFAGQPMSQNFGMTGFNGGFYGGCDYQAGAWVVGVEADWSLSNKEGQGYAVMNPISTTGGTFFFTQPTQYQMQERWFSTIRGRLGYAVDKWLLFVSGGAAFARIDSSTACLFSAALPPPVPAAGACPPNGFSLFQTDNRSGYTVGAGIEYGLSYGWSVRSEYLYVSIPSYTTFTPGVNNPATGGFPNYLSTKMTNNIYRFGLTYKFGNYAAAVVTK
jgi:outer membrane immunogenic protein